MKHITDCKPLPADDLAQIAVRTADLIPDLHNARILVIGASGFVGSWMVESLAALREQNQGTFEILAGIRSHERYARSHPHLVHKTGVTPVLCDVCDEETLARIVGVTHVIHAGSMVNGRYSAIEALHVCETINAGTRRLLDRVESWPLQRLLFISTGGVYGTFPPDLNAMPEGAPYAPATLLPGSAYGISKRAAELQVALHAQAHGYAGIIARLWAFIGPRLPLDKGFAVGNFIRDALSERPIQVMGDGTALRSYQYAADMAVWLLTMLTRGRSSAIYHVGSDNSLSISELATAINGAIGGQGVIIHGVRNPRNPIERYIPSLHQTRSELRLSNECSLDIAIHKTATWLTHT